MKIPKIIQRTVPDIKNVHSNKVLHRILAARGITDKNEIDLDLKKLLRPTDLSNIDKAVSILIAALKDQKNILIVGDYDVDGATSTALIIRVLRLFGYLHLNYITPNRFKLGYGFSLELLKKISPQETDLIITVDNGISSIAAIKEAKNKGFEVIVTDHHLPSNELPIADAIVNPNLKEDSFKSKNLAGVGVVFYLLSALRKELTEQGLLTQPVNLGNYLDLVALGTIADVVPLDQNNRLLVKNGLKKIRSGRCIAGIKAICEVSKRSIENITSSDLGFALGPRLNAAGRLEDIETGIECLLTDDESIAYDYAKLLDDINKQRREIEGDMKQQAEAQLDSITSALSNPEELFGISLYRNDWHEGVIGILAARIKERTYRPTIVFTDSNNKDEIKGSARSIPGIHIRDALEQIDAQNPGLIIKFGGHAMAAGLTIVKERATEFTLLFDSQIKKLCNNIPPEPLIETDGALSEAEFTLEFAHLLQDAGPWGQGFVEPLFQNDFVLVQKTILGGTHSKLTLQFEEDTYVDGIIFNHVVTQMAGDRINLIYKLDINHYKGNQNLQLMVQKVVDNNA